MVRKMTIDELDAGIKRLVLDYVTANPGERSGAQILDVVASIAAQVMAAQCSDVGEIEELLYCVEEFIFEDAVSFFSKLEAEQKTGDTQ